MINRVNNNDVSFGQKYRVILSQACPRTCEGCINTVKGVLGNAQPLHDLRKLNSNGDDIIITGGDPAVYPKLQKAIDILHENNPFAKLFIYSSKVNQNLLKALPKVDGLSFTLHDGLTKSDVKEFDALQHIIKRMKRVNPSKDFSFRLAIDDRIDTSKLPLDEKLYTRLNVFKWLTPKEIMAQKDRNFGCPADEQLVLLKKLV